MTVRYYIHMNRVYTNDPATITTWIDEARTVSVCFPVDFSDQTTVKITKTAARTALSGDWNHFWAWRDIGTHEYLVLGYDRIARLFDTNRLDSGLFVKFDADEAYSVSTVNEPTDSVMWTVGRFQDGYYFTLIVDCDAAGFVDTIFQDEGPYDSHRDAALAGYAWAVGWHCDNDTGRTSVDSRIQKMVIEA